MYCKKVFTIDKSSKKTVINHTGLNFTNTILVEVEPHGIVWCQRGRAQKYFSHPCHNTFTPYLLSLSLLFVT
jgi:hypothetical protein